MIEKVLRLTVSGAVILGGAHGALALARSLGAAGAAVSCIGDDAPLPGWSRHVRRHIRWAGPHAPDAAARLIEIGRAHALEGSLLVPAGDAEICLVAQNHALLSTFYRLALPPWEALRWVCDKALLYRRATELDIAVPRTYRITSADDLPLADLTYPVVLKPYMGGGRDAFTKAKAVRADDEAGFVTAFRHAAGEIGAERVVVQELIPGGGSSQFSYGALWRGGRPVAEFTAKRVRQYPVDFGYTSTFVETVDEPRAVAAARAVLSTIGHEGLVEVEFKHDHRDGRLKLLDVNPRPWAWFSLCAAAGVDLGTMLSADEPGDMRPPPRAQEGVAWLYLSRDVASAGQLISRGQLRPGAWLRSYGGVRAFAAFSATDPLPGLIDLPLTAWRVLTRRRGRTTPYRTGRELL